MSNSVDFSKHGAIGVVTVNNPPVNALSQAVRQGIVEGLDKGLADDEVKAIVVIAAGRTFMAGADITEFGKPLASPDLNTVIERLEDSPKPVIAALHGTALGGGLEVALGCHFRCAAAAAKVGLPEVKLGILPGAGGTQRLPRLVGARAALEMIVSGDPIPAARAAALGIVDEVVGDDLLAGAIAFAEKVLVEKRLIRRVRDIDDKVAADRGNDALFADFRKSIERRARGYFAPFKCIESVRNAVDLPFEEGLRKERELFVECMASPQSGGLIHAFFAERQVNKIPDVPRDTPLRPIGKAAVIGAGTMGGGIAMNFANASIPVTILEMSREALDRGLGIIARNYENTVRKGRLSQAKMDQRMALLTGTLDYDDLGDADIVIEAVFEEMAIKREVFGRLDAVCKPEAILATNTSTLDVNEIAAATTRPESVIGLHFFSPANVMRLLEEVRGEKTAKDVIATCMALAKTIRKVGVLVGVCDGFVGNRMLAPYLREAGFLLEEGALPQQVDRVIYDFGMAMGPFAMADLAGNDVGWRIRKGQAATRPSHLRYSPIADRICEIGRFGQKTGAGWYRYEPGNRVPQPDPEVEKIIVETSKELGIERREIDDQEILERCLYPLINEGARILEEGIALRPGDIDIIWLNGYGFPPYRGGPMFHADQIGLKAVHEAICRYRDAHGADFWTPSPLLERLAGEGKGFDDL